AAGARHVARVADAVHVAVLLAGVGDERTVVANVAHAVGVAVDLIGVRDLRTVVERVGYLVAVLIASDERLRPVLARLVAAHAVSGRSLGAFDEARGAAGDDARAGAAERHRGDRRVLRRIVGRVREIRGRVGP